MTNPCLINRILDCSFVTPARESLSEEAIGLIRGLLQKVPEDRLSIEKVMTDHWFTSGDDSTTAKQSISDNDKPTGSDKACDRSSAPEVNGQVSHRSPEKVDSRVKEVLDDQIIDAMIARGMNLSKDAIRRMLTDDSKTTPEAHHDSHHEQPERNGTPPNLHAGSAHKAHEMNHSQYVRATYQLLKDKSAREIGTSGLEGCDDSPEQERQPEEHEKSSKMLFNAKRGKLAARRTHGNGISGLSALKRPLCSRPPELAPLPETLSAGLFALPLARKCSVVSEEGFGTEGNTPEPPTSGMDGDPERLLTPEVLPEDDDNEEEEEEEEEKSASPVFHPPAVLITDTSDNMMSNDKPRFNILHPVSSSPDFLVAVKYEEEQEEENSRKQKSILGDEPFKSPEDLKTGNGTIEHSASRKGSIDSKNCSFGGSIFERFSRKQPLGLTNVRISKNRIVDEQSNKAPTPSVRVIIQSKSLNNIALTDAVSRQNSPAPNGNSSGKTGNDVKIVNSMSAASIGKIVRGDKADCCTIT